MTADIDLAQLDFGYLALFVGQRINELQSERLRAEGIHDLRTAHGYVFQHLLRAPCTITELAQLLGVSQQAASKTVAELVERGLIDVSESADDRRARTLKLSAAGLAIIKRGRKIRARLHAKLATKHGAALDRARQLLAELLEELGGADTVRRRAVREPR